MSITDELREWIGTIAWYDDSDSSTHKNILAIADRIDAEHERECKEQYAIGAEHGIGASIEASMIQTHGYIELPKDADGEAIHVGDAVTCGATVWTVTGLKFLGEGWGICCTVYNEYGGSGTSVYPPSDLRHYHAPTVEDVLYESLKHFGAVEERTPEVEEWLHEQARRLQLREVDE